MIHIIPVGSGSTGNSIYIELDDKKLLVDMGIGFKKVRDALLKHNRNIKDIEAIFITHGHSDHIKARQAITNNTSCDLYTNDTVYYYLADLKAHTNILEFDVPYFIDDLKITMFKVGHDYRNTGGFIFEYHDQKVGYVTDCGKLTKKIYNYLKGSDVIVIESNHDIDMLKNGPYPYDLQKRILSTVGHLSNEECAMNINKLYDDGTNNFLLAHLSRENNRPDIALKETLKALKGKQANVYVCPVEGDDLLTF